MRLVTTNHIVKMLLIGVIFFASAQQVSAASLSNVFDRLSTSRPSPSSPLSAGASSGTGQVSIFNNGSRFLASDSAKLIRGSGGTVVDASVLVGSQSATLTTIYFADTLGAAGQAGTDVLTTPITAVHTVRFTTATTIPSGGNIVLTFPGSANNTASPSATSFAFNGLNATGAFDGSSVAIVVNNATCGASSTVAAPIITCDLSAQVNAGTTVTFLIGCTAQTSGECTTSAPKLINPTKSASAGSADGWRLLIETQDASSVALDTAKIQVGTVESVFVKAEVEPSITFTISGISNGQDLSALSGSCGADTTNAGNATTATEVDLGFLTNGTINIAAQRLRVSTNAATGYAITATSSGQFINPATGFWITGANGDTALTANDTPAPAVITASGTPDFGISPCGARVDNGTWAGSSATGFGSGAKYSNPFNSGTDSFYASLSSYTGGPISNDDTYVRYAGTISGTTPAGIYRNVFTYVATATF